MVRLREAATQDPRGNTADRINTEIMLKVDLTNTTLSEPWSEWDPC
jgi:hypothetical protein